MKKYPLIYPQCSLSLISTRGYIHISTDLSMDIHIHGNPGFYRAMHFSAKRGIAIACRLSVCLSVCL